MADEDEEQKRLQLEEFQRQEAEKARLAAQQSQPQGEVQNAVSRLADEASVSPQQALDYTQRGLPAPTGDLGSTAPHGDEAFWQANPNGAVKDPQTGILIGLGSGSAPREAPPGVMDQYARFGSGRGAPGVLAGQPQPQQFQAPQQMTVHDFIDPMIQSRRSELANERATINRNLPALSKVASGRGQKSPWQLELEKLKVIDHADSVLLNEQHQQSELKRKLFEKNSELREKTAINQDVAGVHNALSNLKARPGSDEYRQALIGIRQQYPNAMKDASVESKLLDLSTTHDREAEAIARLKEAGQQVEVTGVGPKGERYGVKPTLEQGVAKATQDQVAKDFAKSGITPAQFAQRGEVVGVNVKGKQVEDGTHIRITLPDGHHAKMEKEVYDRLNSEVPATQPNPAAAGAQPAATPSQFDYSKIPSGTVYTDPNGVRRRKP